jgi:hypothetical protein
MSIEQQRHAWIIRPWLEVVTTAAVAMPRYAVSRSSSVAVLTVAKVERVSEIA